MKTTTLLCVGVLVAMSACAPAPTVEPTSAPEPALLTLSERAADAFSTGEWPSHYLENRRCPEPVAGYYESISGARTTQERDAAFLALGYELVPHHRVAGRFVIAHHMPVQVRIDFHATSSAFGGDMDPHDIAAMACFVR